MSAKTIMIIEDEEAIRESLRVALELAGFETVTAANGLEAIRWLKDHEAKPNLILLDLMMPVMDGWEFDQALSKTPGTDKIPVIVVTACSGEIESILHSKKTIHKPVDLEELLESVNRYCSDSQQLFKSVS
jgi:CheY-like chemotaxis protein